MNTILRLAALAGLTLTSGAGEVAGPITQQAYVKASNSGMNDQFGSPGGGVALAGDILVVGAPKEDSSAKGVDGDQGDGLDPTPMNRQDGFDSGAAYVFWRYGSGWAQQAYLKSTDTASYDLFGAAAAVSGDTVVVSAAGAKGKQDGVPFLGAVYVFVRDGSAWRQQARLTVPGTLDYTHFGASVAISGDTLVVGADHESKAGERAGADEILMAGAAHVFVRDGGKWSLQARLEASNAGYKTHFGSSVAISGETLIVGATGDNGASGGVNGDQADKSLNSAGAAYVFVREGMNWSQQAYLKAPKPRDFDEFGGSVAISGDSAVVGAVAAAAGNAKPGKKSDERENGPGAAFVFVRDGGKWSAQATLTPPMFEGGEEFGCSVAISGERLVVGAKRTRDRSNKEGNRPGAAYVFTRKAASWDQGIPIMASNPENGDQFGGAVAISADTVAVGAVGEDGFARGINGDQGKENNGNTSSGAAYVFGMPGTEKAGTPQAGQGKGTLEERMFGHWATDWEAMAKAWQPMVEQMIEMKATGPDGKDREAARKKVEEEMKAGFDVMTMVIKRGEISDYTYPGNPEKKTYRVKSQNEASSSIDVEVTSPNQEPSTMRMVLAGEQLTLTEVGDEQSVPMVFRRIDAATFDARRRAAAESKWFKDQNRPSNDPEPSREKESGKNTKGR